MPRSVGEPYKTVSVHIIIEDVENGIGSMRLCLYAFPGDYTTLIMGTRIAVLAPYTKHSKDDPITGALMMRCDHPDGVRVFSNKEEWTEAQKLQGTGRCLPLAAGGFLAHKQRGNDAFRAGKFLIASIAYSTALDAASSYEERLVALNNRVQSYLSMGAHLEALQDAQKALEIDATNLKTLLRKATALL
jgi:hypothetical protein